MTDELSLIRGILEFGFPAVILMQVWTMWRAYERRVDEHIRDLRAAVLRSTPPVSSDESEQQ